MTWNNNHHDYNEEHLRFYSKETGPPQILCVNCTLEQPDALFSFIMPYYNNIVNYFQLGLREVNMKSQ